MRKVSGLGLGGAGGVFGRLGGNVVRFFWTGSGVVGNVSFVILWFVLYVFVGVNILLNF